MTSDPHSEFAADNPGLTDFRSDPVPYTHRADMTLDEINRFATARTTELPARVFLVSTPRWLGGWPPA